MTEQLQLHIEEGDEVRPLWEGAMTLAGHSLGREVVESWLREAEPLSLRDGVLTLGTSNGTARDWIDKKYGAAIAEAFREAHGHSVRVQVVVRPVGTESGPPVETRRVVSAAAARAPKPPPEAFAPIPLNGRYTFERFIVGGSNRFAEAAARAVAQNPGKAYNPLFIYGGVGLGKTHLLQAIGHEILRERPRASVAYISGETFTTHFVQSLRQSREEEFKRWYRGVDIWLVDDIQFIADKSSTKTEFFHTFNELYLTNRQIVLASDRPPAELHLMEDRLRTRLESGLMAEIGAPDLETRMAILEQRAAMEGVALPRDVTLYMAELVQSNIRVLEAALIRLLALASLTRCEVTIDLARSALETYIREGKASPVNASQIQKAVSERFGVAEDALIGPRRDRKTSLARQVAIYLTRELTRGSLTQVGELFGGKTHSTVLYSCQKLEQEMKADVELAAAVQELRGRLKTSAAA
jgi:chromosomal replication initiator protein